MKLQIVFGLVVLDWLFCLPLFSQIEVGGEDKIVKIYADYVSQNMPTSYDREKYFRVELECDDKILPYFEEYFRKRGEWKLSNEEFKNEKLLEIAQKTIAGSDFYMALLGKGARITDAKPILIETATKTCNCISSSPITTDELLNPENLKAANTLRDCGNQSFISTREVIFNEYGIKDTASLNQFINIYSGYLSTNCPKYIEAHAKRIVGMWEYLLTKRVKEDYNRAGWYIVNAIRHQEKDSLEKQFIDYAHFQKALPEIQKTEQLLKENRGTYMYLSANDISEKEGRAVHTFTASNSGQIIFQFRVVYDTDAYGMVRDILLVSRKDIPNLAELEKNIEDVPPPPPPPKDLEHKK